MPGAIREQAIRLPICGGNWNNTSNAGVFNVNLNNARSNANSNIGFRSALLPSAARQARTWKSKDDRAALWSKGVCFHSVPHGRRKMAVRVSTYSRRRGDKQSGWQPWKLQVARAKAVTHG